MTTGDNPSTRATGHRTQFGVMTQGVCNTYVAKPKKSSTEWKARVSDELERLKSSLIRKSDPGIVILVGKNPKENDFIPHTMRWGFLRPFNPSINNSRSDKLDSAVWKTAFETHRCLIPVSSYFEWGEGTGGKSAAGKQAYEISSPDEGDWLWVAGIWEENPELGKCYSMITTAAAPSVAFIHDRMPAILAWDTAVEYLGGEPIRFAPFPGQLSVIPCQSPLTRKKPNDGLQQGNLF